MMDNTAGYCSRTAARRTLHFKPVSTALANSGSRFKSLSMSSLPPSLNKGQEEGTAAPRQRRAMLVCPQLSEPNQMVFGSTGAKSRPLTNITL